MERKHILCYGDSNTWGFMPRKDRPPVKAENRYPWDVRWPGRLEKLLGGDWRVVEEGLNGRTTMFDCFMEEHRNGLKAIDVCLLTAMPVDLVILMLGTNDFQTNIASSALDTARAVQLMLEEAKKMGADRPGSTMKILLMAPAAMDPIRLERNFPLDSIDAAGIQSSRELAGYLKQVAAQMNYAFIDTNDYIRPGEADGTHWDAEGHAKMADVIYEKVKELLG